MNRIDERFAKVKADGRKALITFLTVGDPNLEVSEKAIYTMQEEGVDLIELGVPMKELWRKVWIFSRCLNLSEKSEIMWKYLWYFCYTIM